MFQINLSAVFRAYHQDGHPINIPQLLSFDWILIVSWFIASAWADENLSFFFSFLEWNVSEYTCIFVELIIVAN